VVGCWGVTATGRMLADVHWFSDTVGGLLFGTFVASVLVGAVQMVESTQPGKRS
jgi:membrane-associated phospholipid phosphatase